MYAVCVQAFIDGLCLLLELCQRRIRNCNVCRCKCFVLIQAPDVKFVDGKYAGDFFHIVFDVEYINADRRAL